MMYHSLSEARHPLQSEEQEVGVDPLSSYSNKSEGDSNKNGRRTNSTLDSDGTFNSYRKEWEELFVNNNYLATIRQKGINGQLRSSRFRSICWKVRRKYLFTVCACSISTHYLMPWKITRAGFTEFSRTLHSQFFGHPCLSFIGCLLVRSNHLSPE